MIISIAIICFTLLAALVLVLHHLKSMRATDGEIAKLVELTDQARLEAHEASRAFKADLEDTKSKLTQLGNRTR